MTLRDFLKIEEELAATEAPELDLSKATSEVMSHYLRAWRGRTELVHAVEALAPSASFAQRLNEIRLALRADELERASALIESTSPTNDLERAELGLERCRYHLFQRNYSEVVRLSEPYLVHPATPAQTKMSLLQIRGIAKTYSDSPHEALPELRAAIAIGSCLSAAPSYFASITVMIQAYARMLERDSAESLMKVARVRLDQSLDDDVWLERLVNFQRARVRFAEFFSPRAEYIRLAEETRLLAEWLELRVVARLCTYDLQNAGDTPAPNVATEFVGGSYLPGLQLVLMDHPRKCVRLEDSPQSSRILELLCERDCSVEELFEQVWGYRYKAEIHASHVRTMLSKLRKKLGEDIVSSENKCIRLRR